MQPIAHRVCLGTRLLSYPPHWDIVSPCQGRLVQNNPLKGQVYVLGRFCTIVHCMSAEGKDSFMVYLPSVLWEKTLIPVGITPFRCPAPSAPLSHAAEHYQKNKMEPLWDCCRAMLESVEDGV